MNARITKDMLKGIKSANHSLIRMYKEQLPNLTNIQYDTLVGLLLGDANIMTQNKGKTYRIKFEWSNKYLDYINHIVLVFDDFILSKPHSKKRESKVTPGKIIHNWGFQTVSVKQFNELANLFIDPITHKKYVPKGLVKNNVSDRSLAYWFIDDGGWLHYSPHVKKRCFVLNTQSFTIDDVNQMVIELNDKFNLDAFTKIIKNKPVIVIPDSSYEIFYNLTWKYVKDIKCMTYKYYK